MAKKALTLLIFFFFSLSLLHLALHTQAKAKHFGDDEDVWGYHDFRPLVRKTQRKSLVDNEYGQISAVDISDGIRGPYHIQFFTLEPNSLFLPVLLHADMVLFVHTGSGRLSYADEEETRSVHLRRADIFRLQTGSVFFIQSDLQPERESLRIYAMFSNTDDELFEPAIGAYSSFRNLVRGFDKVTLKQAFKVPDEVIESITSATDPEAIVHAIPSTKKEKKEKKEKKKKALWEMETRFLKAFLESEESAAYNKKKKSGEGYNLFDAEPDFENCNGWSLTVNRKQAAHILKDTNVGLFMVNLTKGSMMGPHWNPKSTEIAIVLQGQGMVRVVCSSGPNKSKQECKNMRFRVKEGDVFAVPRFHPMAQISFNNDSLVFMGFTTTGVENHPQFLAGKQSILQTLDRDILALSFNVSNTTIDQLLAPQADSIILDCTSCAEKEERIMEEEIEKEKEARKREKQEEERRKREEEERKREEEEKRREEEERKREEEEERRREEEERKREEEKKRWEEEERKREEEERRRKEEEEERKREEEEEERRREEEERKREEEERKREEEEARKREEEERERQREVEEEEERRREEEKQRQKEEERERQRREEEEEEEEEERESQREEERRREEERQRQEEEEREREQEEVRRREEDRERERQQKEEEGGGGSEGRAHLKMWTV